MADTAAMDKAPRRVLAGVAVSLVLHAALLYAWQGIRPRPAHDDTPRALSVWLRPPPPPPPEPAAVPEPARESPARRQAAAAPRKKAAPNVIALPERAPDAPPAPDMFTVAPPEAPAAPRFDRDAARKLAGKLATQPDPERASTAVGQIPPKELETETKAARAIAQAKRRDCKDGLPGGLLGPLLLLLDKKDSGCKW
jgi:hypothetical protein